MLTQEKLKSLLSYDKNTGVFTWLKKPSKRLHVGSTAGFVNGEGYLMIGILGGYYRSHRLAWLYVTGEMPNCQVDHIDMNRQNNAWGNLRLATNGQNSMNRKVQKNSSIGHKNITKTKWGQYIVRVQANEIRKKEVFYDLDLAIACAERLRIEMHGSYVKHG